MAHSVHRWLGLVGFGVVACAPAAPERGIFLGADVAMATFETRARHTDLVQVQVVFPGDSEGRALGTNRPALVLLQGGFVGVSDYVWLAERLARRGYVVAIPEHALGLSIFEIDNGRFALEMLQAPPRGSLLDGLVDPRRVSVGGHSLGGVVATKLAVGGGFQALVLLASLPDTPEEKVVGRWRVPTLSVAGALDCSARLDDVAAGAATFAAPSALVVLDGVTHFQFTGSEQKDLDRGCAPSVELSVAHLRIEQVVTEFLDAVQVEADLGASLSGIPGAEVVAR